MSSTSTLLVLGAFSSQKHQPWERPHGGEQKSPVLSSSTLVFRFLPRLKYYQVSSLREAGKRSKPQELHIHGNRGLCEGPVGQKTQSQAQHLGREAQPLDTPACFTAEEEGLLWYWGCGYVRTGR
jgi:hypothetical protein